MNSDTLEPSGDPPSDPPLPPMTAALREKLADLALVSDKCAAVGDGCDVADGSLAAYAARRCEFGSAVSTLRQKLAELGALQDEAARRVMRYSILLEDAATLADRARETRE